MLAIFKREIKSYFTSVIGYVFLVLYLVAGGAVFAFTTLYKMSANVTPFYSYMLVLSAVILPLLTMKSFSEERKAKTEQLLLTAPVSITSMVLGKFLAAYVMFAGCMLFCSLYFFLLQAYGVVKYAILFGNLIASLLIGMVFIAIGVFVSSLTENQLAAAIGTIGIIAGFIFVGVIASAIPSYEVRLVLEFISILSRFAYFSNGYFDFASFIYYASLAVIFVYLTIRVYDRRRSG